MCICFYPTYVCLPYYKEFCRESSTKASLHVFVSIHCFPFYFQTQLIWLLIGYSVRLVNTTMRFGMLLKSGKLRTN